MVAELVRFMREVVREMGEERAVGFLRKFYGWYLRGVDGARELRGAADAGAERRAGGGDPARGVPRGGAAARARRRPRLALLPDSDSDRLLDLPISIYGGG